MDRTQRDEVQNPGSEHGVAGGSEDQLFRQIHSELKVRARRAMRGQAAGHTLQATALVHEVYVRMARKRESRWADKRHFLAVAARAMKQVLIDHARKRKVPQGEPVLVAIDEISGGAASPVDSVALGEALERLAAFDPQMSKAVELRVFSGLQREDVAQTLGLAPRTFDRRWKATRAWLLSELM